LPLPAVRHCHPRSKAAAAAPKHHGSEGRIGPAAGSPDCQTSLSERRESSCKPCLYLPFGAASFQIACCVLQEAFVWHTSCPRTLPQHQNTMAVRDGSGPRPAAQTAKRHFLNAEKVAANLAFTCRSALPPYRSKDAAAAPKHHGSEGRIGPAGDRNWLQTLPLPAVRHCHP